MPSRPDWYPSDAVVKTGNGPWIGRNHGNDLVTCGEPFVYFPAPDGPSAASRLARVFVRQMQDAHQLRYLRGRDCTFGGACA